MSNFPEHDKIDALRYSNPLATNLAHMLLNGRGWVLENKLTDPPVRLPVARLAAALLGVDADAYRRELDARFGIPTVPPTIVDVVTDWSAESAVIDELRALDDEVTARITDVISAAAADSPIAAAAATTAVPHLIADGTVLATPDADVDAEHRGTLLGAAVSLGFLTNEEAAAHPAAGVRLKQENIFGKAEIPVPPVLPVPDLPTPDVEPAFPTAAWTTEPVVAPEPAWAPAAGTPDVPAEPFSSVGQPEPAVDVLALPAFESGQEFVLPDVAPAPALAQTDWSVPAFGSSQFDDLGVTPPDTDFQFGSYNLDQDGAGEDFNQPLLAPTAYDVDAPVEGVAEAVSDAELAARRDEALSYLKETAPTAETEPTDAEPEPFPTPDTAVVPLPVPTFDAPIPSSEQEPVPAPAFEDVVAGAAPLTDPDAPVEHKNFDLLNVPDGRFPAA
ncbi:hypothetical protein ACWGJ9_09910 [Curtobacterium citreum]